MTGLDVSRTMVEIASENAAAAGAAVDLRHGDATAMPFPDESFDLIVCQAPFKNFRRPVSALDEMPPAGPPRRRLRLPVIAGWARWPGPFDPGPPGLPAAAW